MEIREEIFLNIPSKGLTYQYPPFRGNFEEVSNAIDKAGLKKPNSPETIFLFWDAWSVPHMLHKPSKYRPEIMEFQYDNNHHGYGFKEFTGNLYLPKSNEEVNNGVIIDNNPVIENGKLIMNKNDLVKRLQKNDSDVNFVPFGFKIGKQRGFLEKNPYIAARYGKEGAWKLSEIYSGNDYYLESFNSVDNETVGFSSLYYDGQFLKSLCIGGKTDYKRLYSFGVVKNWESCMSAPKREFPDEICF